MLDLVSVEVLPDVLCEAAGRLTCLLCPVFLQSLHHDPVEIAPGDRSFISSRAASIFRHGERRVALRKPPGIIEGFVGSSSRIAGYPEYAVWQKSSAWAGSSRSEARRAHPSCCVALRVDVLTAQLGLLGTHVFECADDRTQHREYLLICETLVDRPGQRRSQSPWECAPAERHEHVRGLDVAVDDALLVGVLDRAADGNEKFQPLPGREGVAASAMIGGTSPGPVPHDEEMHRRCRWRSTSRTRAMFGWSMIASCLLFLPEERHLQCSVHAGLVDLRMPPASNRFYLFGHEDGAHAPRLTRSEQGRGLINAVRLSAISQRRWPEEMASGAVTPMSRPESRPSRAPRKSAAARRSPASAQVSIFADPARTRRPRRAPSGVIPPP